VNAGTLPAGQLACLLYDAAEGMCAGQPLAVIRWNAAIHALQTGHLPCTGSEQAIPRIAASLADPGIAVHLRDNLGNLDQRNLALVTDAIKAANG
jgi:hypothetical protein